MSYLFIRNGIVIDAMTETGEEGIDATELPTDEQTGSLSFLNDATAMQAFVFSCVMDDPTSDKIRWPRHFVGPTVAKAIVTARIALAEQGEIHFHQGYWRAAVEA